MDDDFTTDNEDKLRTVSKPMSFCVQCKALIGIEPEQKS